MSMGEIFWRSRGKLQDAIDRLLLPHRARPRPIQQIVEDPRRGHTNPNVLGAHIARAKFSKSADEASRTRLCHQADRIVLGRWDLFDQTDHDFGPKIDWNYEYKARKHAPLLPAASVDYRDYASVGDCKFVWEPNRHQHWVVLARAYRICGDSRYAEALVEQLESWTDQCPFGRGMNWRSPLELAIRMISWVWAFALIEDASVMTDKHKERVLSLVEQHLREITRKYSRYSSANNHLIGEAAGVFIASSYFSGLSSAPRWRRQSKRILEEEILRQTFDDGGTREQATGYHLFVLEFFLLSGLVARNGGDDVSAEYWGRLEKMFQYVAGMSAASGALPMVGDADDGYVLDLGGRDDPVASLLVIGALLLDRPELADAVSQPRNDATIIEPLLWLLGPAACDRWIRSKSRSASDPLISRAFTQSGYYLLQRGHKETDGISVLMDCGELGFLSIAAHGHADALSLVLRVAGVDVLVDPGTYDYFTFPAWRKYFRSTRAHNTVEIDGRDQSQMQGAFLWSRRASTRCLVWRPTNRGGAMSGEHDGYTRLDDPVVHRRTVTLGEDSDTILVKDEILARAKHDVAIYWHFAEHCDVRLSNGHGVDVDFGRGRLTMELDEQLSVRQLRGSENPPLGWVSRGYHRRAPSVSVVGSVGAEGQVTLTTKLTVSSLLDGAGRRTSTDDRHPSEASLPSGRETGRGK